MLLGFKNLNHGKSCHGFYYFVCFSNFSLQIVLFMASGSSLLDSVGKLIRSISNLKNGFSLDQDWILRRVGGREIENYPKSSLPYDNILY